MLKHNVRYIRNKKACISYIFKILLSHFKIDATWKQTGVTIAGGIVKGDQLDQLYLPFAMCLDDDRTIYIADWRNNRIIQWKCNAEKGEIVAGGNGEGNQTNQLNNPTDVIIDQETNSLIIADGGNRRVMRWSRQNRKNGEVIISDIDCNGLTMDKNGSLYVCDYKKHLVRQWKKGDTGEGTIVAGGNGPGDQLNQVNCPTYIFVDDDYSLYVSDDNNDRVMKWIKDAKEGIVIAGGNGRGDSLRQLSRPAEVIVDQLGQIYVADFGNHRVMRWCQDANEGTIIVGGNGEGQQSNQFNCPISLFFDRQRNLYVVDCFNHRVQKFEIV